MFESWPFTNFHDMNLDWIVGRIKNVEDSEANAQESATNAAESASNAAESASNAAESETNAAGSAAESAQHADSIRGVVDEVRLNSERIDNLIANAGNGTIPSELVDIRVTYDGITYTTAGDAVRAQAYKPSNLNITEIDLTNYTLVDDRFVDGRNGSLASNSTCKVVQNIEVSEYVNTPIKIGYFAYNYAGFAFYDENNNYISGSENRGLYQDYAEVVRVPNNAKYLSLTVEHLRYPNIKLYFVECYATSPLYDDVRLDNIENNIDMLDTRTSFVDTFNTFINVDLTQQTFITDKFVDGRSGVLSNNTTCNVIQNIDVSNVNKIAIGYYAYRYAGFAFYDKFGNFITGSTDHGDVRDRVEIIEVPVNAKYLSFTVEHLRYPNTELYFVVEELGRVYKPFYTLQDAYVAWMNGEKFPVAFYGDSTTDGWRTTNYVANTLGSDHTTGYLYTDVLQSRLREETNNNIMRIYNAGFTGQGLQWALENFENEFINSGVAYSDVRMIGISFGINDAIHNKTEYRAFKNNLLKLCEKCYTNGIQPFLLTTQATYEMNLSGRNEVYANHSYANQIKKDIAAELGLELIDCEKFTGQFIARSKNKLLDIIPDTCHFADIGHNYEGGMYFAHIVPRTVWITEPQNITLYTIGVKSNITWNDGNYGMLYANAQGSDEFKTKLEYVRTGTDDIVVMDVWIFLNKPYTLGANVGNNYSQYLLIDNQTHQITTPSENVLELDAGLHHVQLMSGSASHIECYGLYVR